MSVLFCLNTVKCANASTFLKWFKWDMQPEFSKKQRTSSTESTAITSATVKHSGTCSTSLSPSLPSLLSLNAPQAATSLSMSAKSEKLILVSRKSLPSTYSLEYSNFHGQSFRLVPQLLRRRHGSSSRKPCCQLQFAV